MRVVNVLAVILGALFLQAEAGVIRRKTELFPSHNAPEDYAVDKHQTYTAPLSAYNKQKYGEDEIESRQFIDENQREEFSIPDTFEPNFDGFLGNIEPESKLKSFGVAPDGSIPFQFGSVDFSSDGEVSEGFRSPIDEISKNFNLGDGVSQSFSPFEGISQNFRPGDQSFISSGQDSQGFRFDGEKLQGFEVNGDRVLGGVVASGDQISQGVGISSSGSSQGLVGSNNFGSQRFDIPVGQQFEDQNIFSLGGQSSVGTGGIVGDTFSGSSGLTKEQAEKLILGGFGANVPDVAVPGRADCYVETVTDTQILTSVIPSTTVAFVSNEITQSVTLTSTSYIRITTTTTALDYVTQYSYVPVYVTNTFIRTSTKVLPPKTVLSTKLSVVTSISVLDQFTTLTDTLIDYVTDYRTQVLTNFLTSTVIVPVTSTSYITPQPEITTLVNTITETVVVPRLLPPAIVYDTLTTISFRTKTQTTELRPESIAKTTTYYSPSYFTIFTTETETRTKTNFITVPVTKVDTSTQVNTAIVTGYSILTTYNTVTSTTTSIVPINTVIPSLVVRTATSEVPITTTKIVSVAIPTNVYTTIAPSTITTYSTVTVYPTSLIVVTNTLPARVSYTTITSQVNCFKK